MQAFCRANIINIGFYDGIGVFPRWVTERNIALYLHNNQFWLIRKSEGVSLNQAIIELKDNFKIVIDLITVENVNSQFKYKFMPKEIESH